MDIQQPDEWTVELVGPHGYSHGWVKAEGQTPLRDSGATRPPRVLPNNSFKPGDLIISKGSSEHVARVVKAEPHPNGMGTPTYTVKHLVHPNSSKVGKTERIGHDRPTERPDRATHTRVTKRNVEKIIAQQVGSNHPQTAQLLRREAVGS